MTSTTSTSDNENQFIPPFLIESKNELAQYFYLTKPTGLKSDYLMYCKVEGCPKCYIPGLKGGICGSFAQLRAHIVGGKLAGNYVEQCTQREDHPAYKLVIDYLMFKHPERFQSNNNNNPISLEESDYSQLISDNIINESIISSNNNVNNNVSEVELRKQIDFDKKLMNHPIIINLISENIRLNEKISKLEQKLLHTSTGMLKFVSHFEVIL